MHFSEKVSKAKREYVGQTTMTIKSPPDSLLSPHKKSLMKEKKEERGKMSKNCPSIPFVTLQVSSNNSHRAGFSSIGTELVF